MTKNHPFYLVTNSPWPLNLSLNLINFWSRIINLFYAKNCWLLLTSLVSSYNPLITKKWYKYLIQVYSYVKNEKIVNVNLLKTPYINKNILLCASLLLFKYRFPCNYVDSITKTNCGLRLCQWKVWHLAVPR